MSSGDVRGKASYFMRDIEQARMLLAIARQDLKVLSVLKDEEETPERIFGFHSQQAVEKTLKCWLSLLGLVYPFTHSLNLLFGLLEDEVGAEVDAFRALDILTPYAVQLRYSSYAGFENELDRAEIINQVSELLNYVQNILYLTDAMTNME